jgi:hypothetical protein
VNLQLKMDKLRLKYDKLKFIDDIMQSRDRVDDMKRQRVLRILDLKILILMDKMR